MNDDRLDSFISAQNFCTGSMSDYTNCIANNMRFTEFTDDEFQPSDYVEIPIKSRPLKVLSGETYVDCVPIAIANVLTRVMQTNSYGVVSFRCSEVFNRPRLPLPTLQDLGISPVDIVNIIGVPPPSTDDNSNTLLFEGIPISDGTDIIDYMFNVLNLLIGYFTSVSLIVSKNAQIKSIILNMYDYYDLPDLATEVLDESERSFRIFSKLIENLDPLLNHSDTTLVEIYDALNYSIRQCESNLASIRETIEDDIYTPIVSSINDNTDFTTYDFDITDEVVDTILVLEHENFPIIMAYSMHSKYLAAVYGQPPVYPKEDQLVGEKLIDIISGELNIVLSETFKFLDTLYGVKNKGLVPLKQYELIFNLIKAYQTTFIDLPRSLINGTDSRYFELLDAVESLLNTMTYGSLISDLENLDETTTYNDTLDDYYNTIGNSSKIALYHMITKQQELYNTPIDQLTEVNLGGDFKDSGEFYYADIAYAVGFTKLTDIKSIQIDDEYYEFDAVLDDDGNPVQGVSEAGCTRYTFLRHVLPTYDVKIEMYVYAGTALQPYCPTINKYHNFLTSKYYGMFTKQDGEEMGLYVYKGYKPMTGEVEEVIQLGKLDFNSINLNDPSLDKSSYKAFLQIETKNLTNASSINGKPLSTDDFKYYMASKIVDEDQVSNYPGMAIIEFKNFPLGTSMAFPKIKLHVKCEEPIVEV